MPYRPLLLLSLLLSFLGLTPLPLLAQALPTIEAKTKGLTRQEGYFPIYWDQDSGKVWLEIPHLKEDFLYVVSLPAGLGSNDIGLDRGQLGGQRVVRFEQAGPKVLLIQANLRYRATTTNPAEAQAIRDAFAESVLWGFTAQAQTGERILVDATEFLVRDAHGIIPRLKQAKQGTYKLEASRSAPFPEMLKAFPQNTELEARLTFTSDEPGNYVREAAADATSFSVRVRHSLVKLPPPGFTPRVFDPRAGYFDLSYVDFGVPIGVPKERHFITRHRLIKKNPTAAISDVVKPIVYYLDPGTPEPVRTALLEGARWWADAFLAAGFKDAFRVEMLPAGADPQDVRYNTIQWVSRATRGWSYGSSVTDPRTGEIIKGHVTLGSLRVRQDYLIAEGLLAPYTSPARSAQQDPMLALSLARTRQLSAHEVGHTLGLAHNFAASLNNRASVMDYPSPYVTLGPEGRPSLKDAYAQGIGAWDKIAIRYGYTQFPPEVDEKAGLDSILAEAQRQGLRYITDADSRPQGAANPYGHLWDNGADVVASLQREMAVRQAALARFGPAVIRQGEPLAVLEEVLVPLYLGHRYQVENTAKLLGGLDYSYALRGVNQQATRPVAATTQRKALEELLATVTPAALRLPRSARTLIPPRPPGYPRHRELFDGYTGLTFDAYAPAQTAAGMVFSAIAQPQRAARLVYQTDLDRTLPGLPQVLDRVTARVWQAPIPADAYDASLQRVSQQAWMNALFDLASYRQNAPAVRALVYAHLHSLDDWLAHHPGKDRTTQAHRTLAHEDLDRFLARDYTTAKGDFEPTTPPGAPIGETLASHAEDWLQRRYRREVLLEHLAAQDEVCGY
ncbi:zinc-dependent metalloprotease [Anthocerotibacter panamensis]|uniref:zinc-dependent metalloprotease n=1 Tax=Anthocerotibacter panamensis TaxID=2857077 RepID=UPI001C408641|nr:zinc-dependent metalloprotease [Anthocerotibacter panamensis]